MDTNLLSNEHYNSLLNNWEQAMLNKNTTIVINCLNPTKEDIEILTRAFEVEVIQGERGKHRKDAQGSTVRSYHDKTCPELMKTRMMVVAFGFRIVAEVVIGEVNTVKKRQERYPDQQRQAALTHLKTYQQNGAVYLALNMDHQAQLLAWASTAEAAQVLASVTEHDQEEWEAKRMSIKWAMESPEQIEKRTKMNEAFLKSLDKDTLGMFSKPFKKGDMLGRMMRLEQVGKHALTPEKNQERAHEMMKEMIYDDVEKLGACAEEG
jgi:hypothetical protein